jgi:ppGpp synthetase/RelA/SpoT-type nucleotidyltranferase
MNGPIPPAIPSYAEQVRALQAHDPQLANLHRAEVWYDGALGSKLTEIRNGSFAKNVLAQLPAWSQEYSRHFPLLRDATLEELQFTIKPFNSVINKLYRKNIIVGTTPPILFADCLDHFEDIVRETIVCRYGDGPDYLATKLSALAEQHNMQKLVKRRADEFGYYAIHFTYKTPVEVLDFTHAEIRTVNLTAELQLTSQLQASLRDLTHKLYEVRRMSPGTSDDWKWTFSSPYFRPSYVGHTLHLLESLLVEMKTQEELKRNKDHDR